MGLTLSSLFHSPWWRPSHPTLAPGRCFLHHRSPSLPWKAARNLHHPTQMMNHPLTTSLIEPMASKTNQNNHSFTPASRSVIKKSTGGTYSCNTPPPWWRTRVALIVFLVQFCVGLRRSVEVRGVGGKKMNKIIFVEGVWLSLATSPDGADGTQVSFTFSSFCMRSKSVECCRGWWDLSWGAANRGIDPKSTSRRVLVLIWQWNCAY